MATLRQLIATATKFQLMFSEDIEIEVTYIQNTSVKSEMIGIQLTLQVMDHLGMGGGLVNNRFRHIEIRDYTAYLLSEICHNVSLEPHLQPITGFGQRKTYGTITSSLTPVTLSEASVALGAAAFVAESRKHAANDAKCQELGWSCILLAVETYGNWRKRLRVCSPA
eukprot:Em0021g184a